MCVFARVRFRFAWSRVRVGLPGSRAWLTDPARRIDWATVRFADAALEAALEVAPV
jgi:hypothetical protein